MTRTIPDPTQYIPGLTGMASEIPLNRSETGIRSLSLSMMGR